MLRKVDYIIFFVLSLGVLLTLNFYYGFAFNIIIGEIAFSIFVSIILGTISNFIAKSKENKSDTKF